MVFLRGHRLDDPREAACEVIAWAAVEPDPFAVFAGDDAKPVMLDLVNPRPARRQRVGLCMQARAIKPVGRVRGRNILIYRLTDSILSHRKSPALILAEIEFGDGTHLCRTYGVLMRDTAESATENLGAEHDWPYSIHLDCPRIG